MLNIDYYYSSWVVFSNICWFRCCYLLVVCRMVVNLFVPQKKAREPSMRTINLRIKYLISWSVAKKAGTLLDRYFLCINIRIYLNWAWNAWFFHPCATPHMRQCVVYMNNFFESLRTLFKLRSWCDWIVVTTKRSYRSHRTIRQLLFFDSKFQFSLAVCDSKQI